VPFVDVKKDSSYKTNSLSASSNNYDMLLYVTRQYVSPTNELAGTNSAGMAYLLDVVWNIWIGSKSKFAWKAATVLGLTPSNFMPNYTMGDSLRATESYVYNDKVYCFFDSNLNYWPLVRVSQLNLTVYNDLYTHDKYGTPIRSSNITTGTFYTYHYNNSTWINNECGANRLYNGSVVTYDYFE
jgi:hypothetical protein